MISTLYSRDRATGVGARTANESAPEPPPKPATPEEIWALLGGIPDLEDDQLLAIYDVLVADDRNLCYKDDMWLELWNLDDMRMIINVLFL